MKHIIMVEMRRLEITSTLSNINTFSYYNSNVGVGESQNQHQYYDFQLSEIFKMLTKLTFWVNTSVCPLSSIDSNCSSVTLLPAVTERGSRSNFWPFTLVHHCISSFTKGNQPYEKWHVITVQINCYLDCGISLISLLYLSLHVHYK